MEARPPARLTPAEGRAFAFPVGGAFLVFAGLSWWRGHEALAALLAGVGAVLAVAGALAPTRLGAVERAWMGLAHAISRLTTPVILAIVYFLVITPIGLVMRAVGRNPVRHDAVEGSYWKARGDDRGGMRNQF